MSAGLPARLRAGLEPWLARQWWRARPGPFAWLLWPASLLYRALLHLHHRRGSRVERQPLPVPLLVVGNLVVGGAGKTPTVMAVVQALQQRGHRPGVVSRGHGRATDDVREVQPGDDPREAGDEPLLVRRRCDVPVWVGRNRPAAALALCKAHPEVDVLLSDDGLQHLALHRSAELVVFDERGAGNGLLLPAGPLREALPARLASRTRVLYTAGRATTRLPGALAQRQLGLAWPLPAWQTGDAAAAVALPTLRGRRLVAAAGLAAPEKFFSMLRAAGLDIEPLPLPDHHAYDSLPWPADTPAVVTTEKDAVKLARHVMGSTSVWVVPLDLQLPQALVDDLEALLFPVADTTL